MSKKKVENLLKGVAITGATVGGASILGDANLAYAAELGEEEASALAQGEIVLQVAQEQTEQQAEQQAEQQLQTTIEEIDLQSESASESAASEAFSMSTAVSEAEASYESASTSFSEAGLEDEYLENLIQEIEQAKTELEAAKQNAIDNGQQLDHDDKSNNYYGAGDKLSNLLIQYAFYQEGYVGEIMYSEWDSSSYNTNSVKVTYVDSTGATKQAYFDYVTVDAYGNALVPGFYDSKDGGQDYNNPNVVDGIMVVEKTLEYKDEFGNVLTWEYSTETGADGQEKTVCYYYINGQEIADNVEVTINEDDTFTLTSTDASPEVQVVKVTEENLGYKSYIYDAEDNTVYHDLGMYANAAGEWNNSLVGYTRNSADFSVGVVETDEEGNTTVSTLVDAEGNAVNLINKRPEYANSDQWNWLRNGIRQYSAFSIGGKTYYYYTSNIINNHDGTYTFTGYYDEAGSSYNQQSITLYSASAASSSLSFTPSFVNKEGDGTEVYTNYNGEIKDGNFGVKGCKYFSLEDFNRGRDEYHAARSEVTSRSESLSELLSQSDSLSESASVSATASEHASESRAESLSESASTSESISISDSESTSESISESESMSMSEAASQNVVRSETASNYVSVNENVVISASEVNEVAEVTEVTEVDDVAEDVKEPEIKQVRNENLDVVKAPLAVKLDDMDDLIDADTIHINEKETPLAVMKSGIDGRSKWHVVAALFSLLTGKVANDKRKSTETKEEDIDN